MTDPCRPQASGFRPQRSRRPGRVAFVVACLIGLCVAATAIAFAQDNPPQDILVSRQLAAAEGLKVGQIVTLARGQNGTGGRAFRIAGTYEPTPDPVRLGMLPRETRLHLPDLLALTRDPRTPAGTEVIEGINIAVRPGEDPVRFARDLNARMPGVFAQPAAGATDTGSFVVLERFHFAIALVTIVAATVFLLALTIMLVDERRETVGVLRLIGLPASRILFQVLTEGVVVAGAGALFGLVLALAGEGMINHFFQWRYDTALIFVRITPDIGAACVAIALPLGAGATVAASWALLRRSGLRLVRR